MFKNIIQKFKCIFLEKHDWGEELQYDITRPYGKITSTASRYSLFKICNCCGMRRIVDSTYEDIDGAEVKIKKWKESYKYAGDNTPNYSSADMWFMN